MPRLLMCFLILNAPGALLGQVFRQRRGVAIRGSYGEGVKETEASGIVFLGNRFGSVEDGYTGQRVGISGIFGGNGVGSGPVIGNRFKEDTTEIMASKPSDGSKESSEVDSATNAEKSSDDTGTTPMTKEEVKVQ